MQMIDNAVILLLIVGAFIGGLKLSEYYHRKAKEELKYELHKQFVRLQAGADHDDPCQPYVSRRFAVPQEFESRLRSNGSATMKVVGE